LSSHSGRPYLLDHSPRPGDLQPRSRTATRRYPATTIPQGAIVDLGKFALIFAPGNLGGALPSKTCSPSALDNRSISPSPEKL
jgi:hypothetical protein